MNIVADLSERVGESDRPGGIVRWMELEAVYAIVALLSATIVMCWTFLCNIFEDDDTSSQLYRTSWAWWSLEAVCAIVALFTIVICHCCVEHFNATSYQWINDDDTSWTNLCWISHSLVTWCSSNVFVQCYVVMRGIDDNYINIVTVLYNSQRREGAGCLRLERVAACGHSTCPHHDDNDDDDGNDDDDNENFSGNGKSDIDHIVCTPWWKRWWWWKEYT